MKKTSRSSGFSLVEIMIAVAAMGGLSLVLLQMNKTSTKATVKSQFDSDVLLITNEINGILSDPVKCLNTFTNPSQTISPSSINNSKYFISSNGSAPAKGYGNSGLNITSYSLALGATANDGILTIAYQNKNILKGSSGAPNINKIINLYITGTPGTSLTGCRSLSSSTTDIWSKGAGSNIYYSGGNVGIGMSNPSAPLEVSGDIKGFNAIFTGNLNAINGNFTGPISATTGNFSGNITSAGVIYTTSLQYTSDKKLKKDIIQIDDGLKKILALRGVQFNWRKNNIHDVGFIAQDVKKVIPDIVKFDSNREVLTVDYVKVVPFLVEAIKSQQRELDLQRQEIDLLKNEIEQLKR